MHGAALFAHLLPMDDGSLLVRCIPEGSAAVGADKLIDLIVEQRLVVIDIGQLLGQGTGVGGKDAGKLFLARHTQHLVLHEVHAGDVLARIQFLSRAHHEGVEYLIQTLGQIVVAAKGARKWIGSVWIFRSLLAVALTVWDPRRTREIRRQSAASI